MDGIKKSYFAPILNGSIRERQIEKQRKMAGFTADSLAECRGMVEQLSVRLDKWLWAVRVFKTRALACAACRKGHVSISGQAAKPSRDIHPDEVVIVRKDNLTLQFKVLGLLDRRVGASEARLYAENQTPPSELEKPRQPDFRPFVFRPKGSGRPTKKDRRETDRLSE